MGQEQISGFADYVKYGPMAFVAKLRNSLFRNMGACLAPVNAYLNIIGLETLGLRMERECSNALELASWIENNYHDIKVNYPGLCSSKWHEIAKNSSQTAMEQSLQSGLAARKRHLNL